MSTHPSFDPDSPALAVALAVRFLLELALLLASALIVWELVDGFWQWPLTILTPIVVAVLWALFLSPKAPVVLPTILHFLIEAALFIGAGIGLFMVGHVIVAGVGVIIWIADKIAIAVLDKT